MNFVNFLTLWITIIGAICSALVFIWKWWLRGKWLHWKKNKDAVRMLVDYNLTSKFDKVFTELSAIKYQLYPNGGNSLKDDVAKVLHNQSITRGTLDAMLYLDDIPTFKCDMDGNCFFVNAAWLHLLGFNNPDDAYGQGWLRTIHPPEKEKVRLEFQQAIVSETQYVGEMNKVNIADSTVIPVKMVTRIVRDENDYPIEIVGQLKIKTIKN